MYIVGDDCILCGACAAQCPTGAIAPGEEHMEINQDVCVQCGGCFETCPMEAISKVD